MNRWIGIGVAGLSLLVLMVFWFIGGRALLLPLLLSVLVVAVLVVIMWDVPTTLKRSVVIGSGAIGVVLIVLAGVGGGLVGTSSDENPPSAPTMTGDESEQPLPNRPPTVTGDVFVLIDGEDVINGVPQANMSWEDCPAPIQTDGITIERTAMFVQTWSVQLAPMVDANDPATGQPIVCEVGTIDVEIRDLPRNTFLEARNARELDVNPFDRVENVTWGQTSTRILFTFIPPQLRFLRPVVEFSRGMSSVGEIAVMVGSVGLTSVATLLLQPLAEDYVRERVRGA